MQPEIIQKHQPCAQKTTSYKLCSPSLQLPCAPQAPGKSLSAQTGKMHLARGQEAQPGFHEQALGECFRENKNPVCTLFP